MSAGHGARAPSQRPPPGHRRCLEVEDRGVVGTKPLGPDAAVAEESIGCPRAQTNLYRLYPGVSEVGGESAGRSDEHDRCWVVVALMVGAEKVDERVRAPDGVPPIAVASTTTCVVTSTTFGARPWSRRWATLHTLEVITSRGYASSSVASGGVARSDRPPPRYRPQGARLRSGRRDVISSPPPDFGADDNMAQLRGAGVGVVARQEERSLGSPPVWCPSGSGAAGAPTRCPLCLPRRQPGRRGPQAPAARSIGRLGGPGSARDVRRYGRLARLLRRLEGPLSRRADVVIANSDAGRKDCIAHGFPADRVAFVPNGIDTDTFRPDRDRRRAASSGVGSATG